MDRKVFFLTLSHTHSGVLKVFPFFRDNKAHPKHISSPNFNLLQRIRLSVKKWDSVRYETLQKKHNEEWREERKYCKISTSVLYPTKPHKKFIGILQPPFTFFYFLLFFSLFLFFFVVVVVGGPGGGCSPSRDTFQNSEKLSIHASIHPIRNIQLNLNRDEGGECEIHIYTHTYIYRGKALIQRREEEARMFFVNLYVIHIRIYPHSQKTPRLHKFAENVRAFLFREPWAQMDELLWY